MKDKVRIHCGSGYVKGRAKRYTYYVASLFIALDDRYINSGKHIGPFRSIGKTKRLAKEFAEENHAEFIDGYGSLHNVKI